MQLRQKIHRGDTVTVYQCPFTKQDREGRARVLEVLSHDPDTGEHRCRVRFADDGFVAQRSIY